MLTKIVFVFAILGIIVITALGLFFLNELNQINGVAEEQIEKVKNGICLAIIIFMLGTLLGSLFVSKVIFKPISKLIKSVEEIKNFLAFLSLPLSVLKLTELIIEREITNASNRATNCDLANVEKQVEASAKQISAINKIKKYN